MSLPAVLCVCLGNICRSPMAEGVLRAKAASTGVALTVESAGTGGWHLGNAPDVRAIAAARARGIDISGQRARQVVGEDLARFDLIVAMDRSNLAKLEAMAAGLPEAERRAEIALFHPAGREIPDPYYGGAQGFDLALDLIEEAAEATLCRLSALRR